MYLFYSYQFLLKYQSYHILAFIIHTNSHLRELMECYIFNKVAFNGTAFNRVAFDGIRFNKLLFQC